MIRTIVFDIGQVLAHFRWKEYIDEFHLDSETTKKLIYATVENIDHWSLHDRGAISDEEFIKLCIQRAPDIETEIRMFFEQIEHIVVEYDYAADLVKQLKQNGYHVYLLSNYGSTTFEFAKKKFKFIPYVDGGIISYEVKLIKPEREIYEYLLDKYKINPEEAVFLDDRLDNIEAAKECGFHTIHFMNYKQGMQELKALQVNLDGIVY
jgi:putative hydrolase of the HAD superfamily